MRRLLIIVALLFAHTAWSGDYDDGWIAYELNDYNTAFTKFRSAARQGHARAEFYLGVMYQNGKGVIQDYKEAVRWYTLAAKKGEYRAQNNLGNMYRNGQGLAKDFVRAHMWYNIASAVGGDKEIAENRDSMASKMTPQQIEQAQRMARECMASNFKKCD